VFDADPITIFCLYFVITFVLICFLS